MERFTRVKKNANANAKKRDILRILSAPVRYIKKK